MLLPCAFSTHMLCDIAPYLDMSLPERRAYTTHDIFIASCTRRSVNADDAYHCHGRLRAVAYGSTNDMDWNIIARMSRGNTRWPVRPALYWSRRRGMRESEGSADHVDCHREGPAGSRGPRDKASVATSPLLSLPLPPSSLSPRPPPCLLSLLLRCSCCSLSRTPGAS